MNTDEFACRSCGQRRGRLVADLGNQPLANNLLRPDDSQEKEPRFPLRVVVCEACWLMQISDLVPPVDLFSDYVYFSSFSDAMLAHAKEAAARYIAEFQLSADSFVVEVASNDGYLLRNFVAAGIPALGVEPAANVAAAARTAGVETVVDFFSETLGKKLAAERRSADLILGNNVFAHAPEINDFTAGLAALVAPRGAIVLEFPYAGELIDKTEFDTIYHEHVFYYFLTPLLALFARHGLEIFRVERLPIHGGSLRLFAGRIGSRPVEASVFDLVEEERSRGVSTTAFYEDFRDAISRTTDDLRDVLAKLKAEGRSVAAYGASAKGSTLLNFLDPAPGTIDFVADRSPYKQGRLTPGLHLPIVGPEALLERQPDFTLLLTWNFADEILAQQAEYRRRGGKFIIPIPRPQIVD